MGGGGDRGMLTRRDTRFAIFSKLCHGFRTKVEALFIVGGKIAPLDELEIVSGKNEIVFFFFLIVGILLL